MIKKALNHELNTVCVNEEQVERMLEVFEKLGMLAPPRKIDINEYKAMIRFVDVYEQLEYFHKWDKE
jgi:hypothetical protein